MRPDLPKSIASIFIKLSRIISVKHGTSFRINTIHMLRANVIAQAVMLLSTPLLSRLYSSNDFGQFAFFYATVAVAVSVTTGRFDWSIPSSRSAGAAAALFRIGLLFIMVTSLAASLLVAIALVTELPLLIDSGIGAMVFFVPLAMVSFGIIELFNGWYVRTGNLKSVGSVKIAQSVSNTALSVLGGLAKFGSTGLISSLLVSSWLAVGVFARDTREIQYQLARTSKTRMSAIFRRFRGEAALSTAVSVTNALSATASIFMIASFFTLQELGWYALMQRLGLAPVGLLSSSIGKSFWSTAAGLTRVKAYDELRAIYLRTTVRLCILIIPIVIGCGLAPFFIGPLFGSSEWSPAGYVLLAMTPHIIGAMVFSPTNHLIVYGFQSYQLFSDILVILLIIASVLITTKFNLGIVVCTAAISSSILTGYVIRFSIHLYANSKLRNYP